MKGRSYNDNNKRNAILFQNGETSLTKGTVTSSQESIPITRIGRVADNLFILGNAYSEPQPTKHIENILLQRDFIID